MPRAIAIDFETAYYARNSAIALGLSVIENGCVTETRSWLFRPPGRRIYIRPDFIDIHGIRPEHLEDKPHFSGVWSEIQAYLYDGCKLIAHNAGFDRAVLYAVAETYNITLPAHTWACTVNLSRTSWPALLNHKLPTVCAHLGINLNHHDAASDAQACARIYLAANECVTSRGEAAA